MKRVQELTNEELTAEIREPRKYQPAELAREATARFVRYVGHGDLPEFDRWADMPSADQSEG